MKPPVFAYRDPRSLPETLSLLAEHGSDASILAGGQSLIPLLNLRLARPEVVIDINRVPGLDGVDITPQAIRVGALARVRSLEGSAPIRGAAPALSAALGSIAHPQIRSRTTIGGNISHADPSSELPGLLAAYDGRIELTTSSGQRWVGWDDFFLSVFTTSREPDELVTAVEFPCADGFRYDFEEIARRPGDYPLSAVCAGVATSGSTVTGARLAAVAIADRPVRLREAEASLVGASLTDATAIREVARTAAREIDPVDDDHGSAAYRRGIVRTLVERTLTRLASGGAS